VSSTYLAFVAVNQERVVGAIKNHAKGFHNSGRVHAHHVFVGGNFDHDLSNACTIHKLNIGVWEGFRDKCAKVSLAANSKYNRRTYRMVFNFKLFRKLKFSGSGKLLRYTAPGITAPKLIGGSRDVRRSGACLADLYSWMPEISSWLESITAPDQRLDVKLNRASREARVLTFALAFR
jgi:hypothetical protein